MKSCNLLTLLIIALFSAAVLSVVEGCSDNSVTPTTTNPVNTHSDSLASLVYPANNDTVHLPFNFLWKSPKVKPQYYSINLFTDTIPGGLYYTFSPVSDTTFAIDQVLSAHLNHGWSYWNISPYYSTTNYDPSAYQRFYFP